MCKMRLQLKENTERSETDRSKINRIMKQLTQIEQNRFQTIHMLEEHEVRKLLFSYLNHIIYRINIFYCGIFTVTVSKSDTSSRIRN